MEQLQIPKGKIIDLEKSDLSKNLIVLKDVPKKLVVDSWEELGNIKGFFINPEGSIKEFIGGLNMVGLKYKIYPTKKHIKRALAEAQLLQIRQRALEEYGGWEPDWEDEEQTKYCLTTKANNIILLGCNSYFEFLSFPTEEMAEEFLAKHKGLLMDWFMIENK